MVVVYGLSFFFVYFICLLLFSCLSLFSFLFVVLFSCCLSLFSFCYLFIFYFFIFFVVVVVVVLLFCHFLLHVYLLVQVARPGVPSRPWRSPVLCGSDWPEERVRSHSLLPQTVSYVSTEFRNISFFS